MTRRVRTLLGALGLGLVQLFAGAASAQDERATLAPLVRELAGQGAEAYKRKDYEAALLAFRRAEALLTSDAFHARELANARFNIALCLDAMERTVDALAAYEVVDLEHVPPDHARKATQRIEALEAASRRATLRVQCVSEASARVALAEIPGPVRPCGETWSDLEPGTYNVRARSRAGEVAQRSVTLGAGENREVELVWVARTATPAAEGGGVDRVAWIFGGLGGVSLAVGAGLLLGAHQAADEGAAGLDRQSNARDEIAWVDAVGDTRAAYERAESYETAGVVLLGTGVACAGYAVWRWFDGAPAE
jgi:tetratricopeptide (TPR) repeat protein